MRAEDQRGAVVVTAQVTTELITVEKFISEVKTNSAGATVSFCGDVRDQDHGKQVVSLKYEIHPSTQEVLQRVVQEVANRHDVLKVAVAHRYGMVPIGESALVVAVSAAHRAAAFAACSELVNEVKAQIPIWKHQVFADGTDEWVNCA